MSLPDRRGRRALGLYAGDPAAHLHVWVRWLTAPFPAVEAELPRTGRILEIGCGHGLFAAYAALSSDRREVAGSDIDADKIAVAARVARGAGSRLRFETAPSGRVPDGPWDAIVILDVLYLLSAEQQRLLLLDCAGRLADGGRLLVKEMAERPAWKARWNRLQETLSVRVLGITDSGTRRFTFVRTEEMCSWLREAGLTARVVPLDRGYPHPHQLIVAEHAG